MSNPAPQQTKELSNDLLLDQQSDATNEITHVADSFDEAETSTKSPKKKSKSNEKQGEKIPTRFRKPKSTQQKEQTKNKNPPENQSNPSIVVSPSMTQSQVLTENIAIEEKPEMAASTVASRTKKKTGKGAMSKPIKKIEEVPEKQPVQNFDEMPIGKTAFNISEFPQEQAPKQTTYTMSQKLKSKAVKLRMSGLEDLLGLLQEKPDHPDCQDIELQKFLKETNPGCLEKALQCFKIWVENGGKWGEQQGKLVIENGYINGKPNQKEIAVEICDLLYEKNPDCLQMAILVGLKGKTPKNLAGYIEMVQKLLAIYGIKRMKYLKVYLPEVVKILNKQKLVAVKTAGLNLLSEACKWLTKEVVDPFIKDLRDNLKQWLESFWDGYEKGTVMTAPKDIVEEKHTEKKRLDAYEIAEAVQIFKKYNEKFCDSILKEKKWDVKVKLMQQFYNAANIPKIAITDHTHVKAMIKRLIKDSNFNVVLWNLKIVGALAKGMRKPFSPFVKSIFYDIVVKFKDKKTQMIEQTFNTLNSFSYCISLEDVLEILKQNLTDKNPNMKVNLINWIGAFVQARLEEEQLSEKAIDAIKTLFPTFEKLLNDSNCDVRDTMARIIGKMKVMLGQQFFASMQNKVKKQITKKIVEEVENSEPKEKEFVSPPKKESHRFESMSKQPKKLPKRQVKVNLEEVEGKEENVVNSKHKLEEQLQKLMPKLNHSDWQKRKESCEAIVQILKQYEGKKVNSNSISELLTILKVRIADPNKHIIKNFVHLTGIVFEILPERQVKGNGKNFICGLSDGLSDKVEANRKQICQTLNKISLVYGKQNFLALLAPYLDTDKEARIQFINLILQNREYFDKTDTRDYPKGIIRCLSDKNKQIRNLGEQVLEIVAQKMGLEVFRRIAKTKSPAIAKDLQNILDKYDKTKENKSTISTKKGTNPKGVPPTAIRKRSISKQTKSIRSSKENFSQVNRPPSQNTIKAKPMPGKNLKADKEKDGKVVRGGSKPKEISSSESIKKKEPIIYLEKKCLVKMNSTFAQLQVLSAHKEKRKEKDEENPWNGQATKPEQEEQLIEYLSILVKEDLVKKMLSFCQKRVSEFISEFGKMCRDASFQNQIKQIYDLIFKLVFLRLEGGVPSMLSIIEVLPPLVSVLEKKKIKLSNKEVDLMVGIARQYIFSASMCNLKLNSTLNNTIKCLTSLCSPEYLLRRILNEFSVEMQNFHKYATDESTVFYRSALTSLIKSQFMEHIGNENMLQLTSQIKQLKSDEEFVKKLFQKFNQNVLSCFGFKKKPKSMQTQSNSATSSFNSIQVQNSIEFPQKSSSILFEKEKIVKSWITKSEDIKLDHFNHPHKSTPLGKNLDNLLPPNEKTINFFNNYLLQIEEKTAQEQVKFAELIYGSILKSVILAMENRTKYEPQKVLSLISILHQAIKCECIINNSIQFIEPTIRYALPQLIYEDANQELIKKAYESEGKKEMYHSDKFIKNMNGVMKRILDNACPQQIANILIEMINEYFLQENKSNKTLHTLVKCLMKVSSSYTKQLTKNRTKKFMTLMNNCLNIIQLAIPLEDVKFTSDKLTEEENTVKSLIEIMMNLLQNYKEEIWILYGSIQQLKIYHDYIPSFLQHHEIKRPENFEHLVEENQHLKKICDHFSQEATYNEGIQLFKAYISQNSQFQPIQYLVSQGFSEEVVKQIMNRVEGRRVQKPTKDSESEDSIGSPQVRDKIKMLKMKFDQVGEVGRRDERQIPGKGNNRTEDIKKKIEEMKNRMNNGQ